MTTSPGVPEPSAQLLRLAAEVRQAAMALGQSDDNILSRDKLLDGARLAARGTVDEDALALFDRLF